MRWIAMAAIAALGVSVFAQDGGSKAGETAPTQKAEKKVELTDEQKKTMKAELAELSTKADVVTAKMSALAASSELSRNNDALEMMKELLSELQEINERLDYLESELGGVAAGQGRLADDVAKLNRHVPTGYFQFQFRDSDQMGKEQSSFNFRRVRVGYKHQLNDKADLKFNFDLAAGDNQTSAELKDVILNYQIAKSETGETMLSLGQFIPPLGFDLTRSSSAREFPEFATYNRLLFNGERVRGLMATQSSGDLEYSLGVANSLTVKDKEQEDFTPGPKGRLAAFGGIRFARDNYNVGLGAFAAERPSFTGGGGTSPAVDRNFVYLDGSIMDFLTPGLELRAEAMFGKDRLPSTTGNVSKVAHDLSAYQLQLLYRLDAKNQIFGRYVQFDSDTDSSGNTFFERGLGVRHLLDSANMLTFTYEWMHDPTLADPRYRVATFRWQFKF